MTASDSFADLPLEERPRTAVEGLVGEVVVEFLGRSIGRTQDFFSIGLTSLMAGQIFTRIQARFGVEIELEAAFSTPTLAGLAILIEEQLMALVEGLSEDEAAELLLET
jgi:acyl carrier protein